MESISKMKNTEKGLNRRFELAEERARKPYDRSVRLSSLRKGKRNRMKKQEQSQRLCDVTKCINTCPREPQTERRERKEQKLI